MELSAHSLRCVVITGNVISPGHFFIGSGQMVHHYFTRCLWVPLSRQLQQTIVSKLHCQTSDISHTLVGNKIVDHSDVVGALPVGAAPTTSSFLTLTWLQWIGQRQLQDRDEKHLSFGIWCILEIWPHARSLPCDMWLVFVGAFLLFTQSLNFYCEFFSHTQVV